MAVLFLQATHRILPLRNHDNKTQIRRIGPIRISIRIVPWKRNSQIITSIKQSTCSKGRFPNIMSTVELVKSKRQQIVSNSYSMKRGCWRYKLQWRNDLLTDSNSNTENRNSYRWQQVRNNTRQASWTISFIVVSTAHTVHCQSVTLSSEGTNSTVYKCLKFLYNQYKSFGLKLSMCRLSHQGISLMCIHAA